MDNNNKDPFDVNALKEMANQLLQFCDQAIKTVDSSVTKIKNYDIMNLSPEQKEKMKGVDVPAIEVELAKLKTQMESLSKKSQDSNVNPNSL